MPKKEIKKEWKEKITEGNKDYVLNLKLFKSTLKILDDEGNSINVDKRDNKIKIQRWGNVEWHREKRFNPTFKNGGFWESYIDLERQFLNFLEYVPYFEGNENTYSFRLANLILSIGAHIDSAFKEIAKYPVHFSKLRNPNKIHEYFPISEFYKLPEEAVIFKCLPDREKLFPFEEYRRKNNRIESPYWWRDYNKVKHNFNENFKEAKLKAVRDALAGAFLLNVIHEPAIERLVKYGLIEAKYGPLSIGFEDNLIHDKFRGRSMQPKPTVLNTQDPFIIQTQIFLYDYEKPLLFPAK